MNAILLILLSAASSWALDLRGGASQTFGENNYRYSSANLTLGLESGWYAKPSFAIADSSGVATTRTYGLRLGYDGDFFGAGADAAVTPRAGGYQSTGFGADATVYFSPGGDKRSSGAGEKTQDAARDKGLVEAYLGAGAYNTRHSESLPAFGAQPAREAVTNQLDLSANAGAQVFVVDLSAGYTKSLYDRRINERPRQALRAQAFGFNPAIFGFPEYKFDAQAIWLLSPLVKPFVSFLYTDYKVDQPASRSYAAGATVKILKVRVKGSYELYDPGGGAKKQSYYSLGASVAF